MFFILNHHSRKLIKSILPNKYLQNSFNAIKKMCNFVAYKQNF